MNLPTSPDQLTGALARRAWAAGRLCGARGEDVRLAGEVARAVWRLRGRLGRQAVRGFWGGYRDGRAGRMERA